MPAFILGSRCPHSDSHRAMPGAKAPGLLALCAALALQGCAPATPAPTLIPSATPTASVTSTPSLTPTPSLSPTPTFPRDAVVEIEALNLRAGPDVLHPLVGVAYQATAVAVEGRDEGGAWLAVRLPDDSRGWMSAAYLDLRKDLTAVPILPTPSPPPTPSPTAIPMDLSLPIVLVPPVVAQGDPVLVRLRAPGAQWAKVSFDGEERDLQRSAEDSFAGLIATALDGRIGAQPLQLRWLEGDGREVSETANLVVQPGGYSAEAIQVGPDRLPLLDPSLGQAETAMLAAIWSQVGPERLWQGRWSLPVGSVVTSPFGGARDYNSGQLISRHTGMDLRGRIGDPVYAPAAGRVVMAEPLSVRGNAIWVDHGWGLYSGYFHLSRIDVIVGQGVERGTYLGAVGNSGRTTAPHLHWEVRIHGRASNPVQWLWRDVGRLP